MNRKPISIGTGIGKRKCDYCVAGGNGKVLETGQYQNTGEEAGRLAGAMARRYSRRRNGCPCLLLTAPVWCLSCIMVRIR